jgi:hypothetical protein
MPASLRLVIVALPLALVLAGCGDSSSDGIVRGEVTLDGKGPLKKGQIRFVPTDTKKRPAEGEIVDGKFEVRGVPVGEAKVEITAPKVVGKIRLAPESPEVEQLEELLPDRYHVRSDMKMTVEKGMQVKTFDVQSK